MLPQTWWTELLDVVPDGPDPHDDPHGVVSSRVVADTDLPGAAPDGPPLTVEVSGGAGQLAGPAALAERRGLPLRALRVDLRDPADLRGNARRVVAAVDAAREQGVLAEDVVVAVGLPDAEPGPDWEAAVDEVAARELAVALPTAGADPLRVAAWLTAVLDRETPITALGGDPVCLVGAVRRSFDGGGAAEVAACLTGPATRALTGLDDTALVGVRRWLLGVRTGPDGPRDLAATLGALGALGAP